MCGLYRSLIRFLNFGLSSLRWFDDHASALLDDIPLVSLWQNSCEEDSLLVSIDESIYICLRLERQLNANLQQYDDRKQRSSSCYLRSSSRRLHDLRHTDISLAVQDELLVERRSSWSMRHRLLSRPTPDVLRRTFGGELDQWSNDNGHEQEHRVTH